MNNNFLEVFHQNLIKDNFSPVEFSINDSKIICFFKQIGNSLYFILPVKENSIDYKEFFEQYEKNLKADITAKAINKIFMLELIICENSTPDLIDYTKYDSNFEDDIIKLRWLIDLNKNSIIVNGRQANRLLNISKLIKNSFNSKFNNKSIHETLDETKINLLGLRKSENIYLTVFIIAILSFIHFYSLSLDIHSKLILFGSTSPTMLKDGEYYRIITAAFLHSDIIHLFSNCISLCIFGSRVEKYLGKANLFIIYTIGIIAGSISSYLFSNSYSVGASGAIFAVEGAILSYSLKSKMKFDGLDFSVIVTMVLIGIVMGFAYPNIDNAGHIGGFISGILMGFIIYFSEKS